MSDNGGNRKSYPGSRSVIHHLALCVLRIHRATALLLAPLLILLSFRSARLPPFLGSPPCRMWVIVPDRSTINDACRGSIPTASMASVGLPKTLNKRRGHRYYAGTIEDLLVGGIRHIVRSKVPPKGWSGSTSCLARTAKVSPASTPIRCESNLRLAFFRRRALFSPWEISKARLRTCQVAIHQTASVMKRRIDEDYPDRPRERMVGRCRCGGNLRKIPDIPGTRVLSVFFALPYAKKPIYKWKHRE